MKNIFRTAYNRVVGKDTKTQYFDPEKLGIAVPDMSYSPREIIERFTMGTLPNIGIPELIQDMDEVELARLLDGDDVEELENDKLLMNQQLGEKYFRLQTLIQQSNETVRQTMAAKQTDSIQEGAISSQSEAGNAPE